MWIAAIASLIAIPLFVGAPAASGAVDAVSTCTQTGTVDTPDGQYTIQNNEWNSSAPQCVTYTSGTAWSVTTANFSLPTNGAPADYPSIFKGCHWGDCTTGSGLPIQVSNLGSATSSWSTTQVGSGAYDVAYDIWFNSTPTTPGQPDGTEIMIWLNSRGGVQPFGSRTGTSTAGGHTWDVWTGQQTSWKIISFVSNPGVTSVDNLDVKALINDAVARGSLNRNHWLLDAEAGFEIWQGGQGLGTNSFSFSATAGGGGGGGGSAGCSASIHVDNSWNGGFTATVTVTNSGTAPTAGWRVSWTWPSGQSVTSMWNANNLPSGQNQAATNMPYNGAVAPGQSTTFGFQANGSAATPTLSCAAS